MEVQTQGRKFGKLNQFWLEIKERLKETPHTPICVITYNHPTLAYRMKREINQGLNPNFPQGEWFASVVKHDKPFYGPRSGKVTYKADLFLIYTPKES